MRLLRERCAPGAARPAVLAPRRRAGDRLRAALWLVLALLAALPARAADQVVAVMVPGGACELRQVPAQALAALTAELELARQDAAGLAQRLAEDAAAAHYAGAREAVPAFGAWAYDWVQSYITAYRIAGRMVASAAAALRGDAAGLADGVVEQMAEPMRRAFVERVLSRAAPADGRRRELRLTAEGERLERQLTGTQMEQLAAVLDAAGRTAEAGWRAVMARMPTSSRTQA